MSLKSPDIPLPDGSRLMLLNDIPSFSRIAVPVLSMLSLINAS